MGKWSERFNAESSRTLHDFIPSTRFDGTRIESIVDIFCPLNAQNVSIGPVQTFNKFVGRRSQEMMNCWRALSRVEIGSPGRRGPNKFALKSSRKMTSPSGDYVE